MVNFEKLAVVVLFVAVTCLAQNGDKKIALIDSQRASAAVSGMIAAVADWRPSTASVSSPVVSRTEMEEFVMKYTGLTQDEGSVCSFAFADLAGDGNYQMIVSIDRSGRRFCNTVVVIRKMPGGFQSATLSAWWMNELSESIKDLEGDGRTELLVPEALTPYEGVKCIAAWTRVFRISDGALVDVSSEFPKFYTDRLNVLRHEVSASGPDSVCKQVELDKIERVLGAVPDAGLAQALDWMKSDDVSLRLKAIYVLSDIGNQRSLQALMNATQDSNHVVSEAAKGFLTKAAAQ